MALPHTARRLATITALLVTHVAVDPLDAQDAPADREARPFATATRVLPYRRGIAIWVRNSSGDTVTVTRVHVTGCLNIGAGCGTTELGLRLAPGDSARALTIRPRLWDDRYVYRMSWEWEVAERTEDDWDEPDEPDTTEEPDDSLRNIVPRSLATPGTHLIRRWTQLQPESRRHVPE